MKGGFCRATGDAGILTWRGRPRDGDGAADCVEQLIGVSVFDSCGGIMRRVVAPGATVVVVVVVVTEDLNSDKSMSIHPHLRKI